MESKDLIIGLVVVALIVAAVYLWRRRRSGSAGSSTAGSSAAAGSSATPGSSAASGSSAAAGSSTASGSSATPSGPNKLAVLTGYNYAKCDGNYVWTGNFTPDGRILFKTASNPISGQLARLVTLDQKGGLTCYPLGSVVMGGGFRSETVGQKGVNFTYDSRLWEQQSSAPKVGTLSF